MSKLLAIVAVLIVLAVPAISDPPKDAEFVFARLEVPNRLAYLQFWEEVRGITITPIPTSSCSECCGN